MPGAVHRRTSAAGAGGSVDLSAYATDIEVSTAVGTEAEIRAEADRAGSEADFNQEERMNDIEAGYVRVVVHADDANYPRPEGVIEVRWRGTEFPLNAQGGDRYVDTVTGEEWSFDFEVPPAVHNFDDSLPWYNRYSPIRIGVATTATESDGTDAATAHWIATATPGDPAYLGTWINQQSYSIHPSEAALIDPVARADDTNDTTHRDGWLLIPADVNIAVGNDRTVVVLQPPKVGTKRRIAHDMAGTRKTSDVLYTTTRHLSHELDGLGFGPIGGQRAPGVAATAGLIIAQEIDPAHPEYTGVIPHGICINAPASMLWKATGITGLSSFDAYGYMVATIDGVANQRYHAYTYPATEADASWSAYAGPVKLGSQFVLPASTVLTSVAVNDLGLQTEAALIMARAVRDYGLFVVDRNGGGAPAIYFDPRVTSTVRSGILATSDLDKIRRACRLVTNSTEYTPCGGVIGATRRAGAPAARDNGGEPIWKMDNTLPDIYAAPIAVPKLQWRDQTDVWGSGGGAAISGGNLVFTVGTSTFQYSAMMAETPYIRDHSLYARFQVSSVGAWTLRFILRSEGRVLNGGAGTSNNGYTLSFTPSTKNFSVHRRTATTAVAVGSAAASAIGTITAGSTWLNLRANVTNAAQSDGSIQVRFQARMWLNADSEPGSWEFDVIDTTPLTWIAGRFGLGGATSSVSSASATFSDLILDTAV